MALHVHTARVSGPSSLSLAYKGGRHSAASAAVSSMTCKCACREVAVSARRAPGSPWRDQGQQVQQQQLLLRPGWHTAEAAAEAWPGVSARQQLQREQKQRQRRFAVRGDAGAAAAAPEAARNSVVEKGSVSVVLLAGGVGKRMGAPLPKQYIEINGRPIALYSLLTFAGMEEVGEIVVVCDPSYQYLFKGALDSAGVTKAMRFALPGKERQDSVYNGLQEVAAGAALVAVHDSARPLVTADDVRKVLGDAAEHGAAVLGVPCKATIKEVDGSGFVARTLERKLLWEIQTPQVMEPQLLRDGFELVQRDNLEVTDDVSIVEHLKRPVRITEGSYTNIKVTTPDDLLFAERVICGDDASAASPAGSAAMSVAA